MGLKFRRGTTAQKSGSLAFGEPYVNTDLGTLQIGGATGDITLGASGTGSAGQFSSISGSGLDITGNANIGGNLTLGGNITIGDNTSDTVAMTANLSSSIIPSLTNTFDLGSPSKQWRHLYISTGSLYMNGTPILSSTANELQLTTDTGQSLKLLETSADTITLQTADGNLTFASSGGGDIVLDPTTGVISLKGTVQVQDGNKITSSGGNTIQFGNNVAITGSLITTTGLIVGGDFVVNGTTTTIDSTNINIGDNIIVLNGTLTTNGGMYVKDAAGGNTATGSMLWDTTNDRWIAGAKGSELAILRVGGDNVISASSLVSISSSLIPSVTNTFDLGSPTKIWKDLYISTGSIKFVGAGDNIVGTLTNTGNGLNLDGGVTANGNSTFGTSSLAVTSVTGSLRVSGSLTTIGASTATSFNGTINATNGVVSGSSQITYASISSIPVGIVSGSSQITYASISSIPGGIVSGSSQVDATATTNWSTGIKTQLNTNTVVSGSSQVTLSSTTGYGTVINQNLLTTSNVQFNSLGIGMAASATAGRIDASGDVVAYSTSDKNFKENITPIENPIEKIRMISGNTYDWKADMKEFHGFEGNDVGVIAQEIEAVLPQLVTTRETGYKAVKYDKLVALLIEGMKAQQNQIDNLTIEIEKLNESKGL